MFLILLATAGLISRVTSPGSIPPSRHSDPLPRADGLDDLYLRVGPVMAIPDLLAERGCDAATMLQEFGLVPAYFHNPDNTLPSRSLARIFGRCVELTGTEHFGLLVGERAGMPSLGPVGYLMQSAPTVGRALEILRQNLQAHDRGGIALVNQGRGYAALGYAILDPDLEHGEQMMAAALAIVMNILRGLCGAHWRPIQVHCAYAAPQDVAPYRRIFGASPRFDADASQLVFAEHWLSNPLPSADPLLHIFMQERVRELLAADTHDIKAQLRRFLRAAVIAPDNSLETAARYFGLHSRTLRRRLEAQGTSFRRIRDEVRFDAACQMLRQTRMPAGEIASVLGYADPAAFTRAFSRHAGVGPARWRELRPTSVTAES